MCIKIEEQLIKIVEPPMKLSAFIHAHVVGKVSKYNTCFLLKKELSVYNLSERTTHIRHRSWCYWLWRLYLGLPIDTWWQVHRRARAFFFFFFSFNLCMCFFGSLGIAKTLFSLLAGKTLNPQWYRKNSLTTLSLEETINKRVLKHSN